MSDYKSILVRMTELLNQRIKSIITNYKIKQGKYISTNDFIVDAIIEKCKKEENNNAK